jgi:hypothetical protein
LEELLELANLEIVHIACSEESKHMDEESVVDYRNRVVTQIADKTGSSRRANYLLL